MSEKPVSSAPSTQAIAERGEAIYNERYCAELEKSSYEKFVAIDIVNGDATLAETGEDAIQLAIEKDPTGFFHLIRVGHKAALQAGWYMSCAR
jgi:hypothetical protein